jgi:hypothetical protein
MVQYIDASMFMGTHHPAAGLTSMTIPDRPLKRTLALVIAATTFANYIAVRSSFLSMGLSSALRLICEMAV